MTAEEWTKPYGHVALNHEIHSLYTQERFDECVAAIDAQLAADASRLTPKTPDGNHAGWPRGGTSSAGSAPAPQGALSVSSEYPLYVKALIRRREGKVVRSHIRDATRCRDSATCQADTTHPRTTRRSTSRCSCSSARRPSPPSAWRI